MGCDAEASVLIAPRLSLGAFQSAAEMLKFTADLARGDDAAARLLPIIADGHIMWISAGQAAAYAGRGHQL
jgi:hypothetical protein